MGKLYKSNQQDISNYDIHIYKHGIFKNPLMCYITVDFTKLLPKSQTGFLEIINNTREGIVIFFSENKRECGDWGANSSPGCRAKR